MKESNELCSMMRQPTTSSIEEEKKNQQEQQIQLKVSLYLATLCQSLLEELGQNKTRTIEFDKTDIIDSD
jgi:hypothetical protein